MMEKRKTRVSSKQIMLKRCGRRCFLGSSKSFPICNKNTCNISKKGVQSSYNCARQYHHNKTSRKAKKIKLIYIYTKII
jgi:hypothetical protein